MFDRLSLLFRNVVNLLIALLVLVLLAAFMPEFATALSLVSQQVKNFLGHILSFVPVYGANIQGAYQLAVSDNQILWLLLYIALNVFWYVIGGFFRR